MQVSNSPLLAFCTLKKLRSRKQHSPKAKSPNTRKGQGSDECKLNGQGGRGAAERVPSRSGFLAGHCGTSVCTCVQHLQEQLLKGFPTFVMRPSFSLGFSEPAG